MPAATAHAVQAAVVLGYPKCLQGQWLSGAGDMSQPAAAAVPLMQRGRPARRASRCRSPTSSCCWTGACTSGWRGAGATCSTASSGTPSSPPSRASRACRAASSRRARRRPCLPSRVTASPSLCWDWMRGTPCVQACGLLSRRQPCPRQTPGHTPAGWLLGDVTGSGCSRPAGTQFEDRADALPLSVHEHHSYFELLESL